MAKIQNQKKKKILNRIVIRQVDTKLFLTNFKKGGSKYTR